MAAQLASVRDSAHTSEQSAREQAQEMLERERAEAVAVQQSWRQQHEELEKVWHAVFFFLNRSFFLLLN